MKVIANQRCASGVSYCFPLIDIVRFDPKVTQVLEPVLLGKYTSTSVPYSSAREIRGTLRRVHGQASTSRMVRSVNVPVVLQSTVEH